MLSRLGFPDIGRQRPGLAAIGIDALGSGVWMPMSVLYFTVRVTDESRSRIGFALSLAAAVPIPFALVGGPLSSIGTAPAGCSRRATSCRRSDSRRTRSPGTRGWGITIVAGVAALGRTPSGGPFSPLVTAVTDAGER